MSNSAISIVDVLDLYHYINGVLHKYCGKCLVFVTEMQNCDKLINKVS